MRIRFAALTIAIIFTVASASADDFFVQVQGAGNKDSATSNVSLSYSGTSTNCQALGGCTASVDASASATPGNIGAYSSASLRIDSAYAPYNTSTNATASYRQDGFVITGPSGDISISFNYTIEGSLSATGDASVGGNAGVSAFLNLGSSRGGYNPGLGGMTAYSDGTFSSSGIFAGMQPQNASGNFTSAIILTFAGDPYVSFGMQLNTSASAGTNGGSGSSNSLADFSHTMMFSTSGPVVNVFDTAGNNVTSLYDISTTDGTIVDNRFVGPNTVPEPASLTLLAFGFIGLGGMVRRKR